MLKLIKKQITRAASWWLKEEFQLIRGTSEKQIQIIKTQGESIQQLIDANHSMKTLCDRYWAEIQGELH